MNNDTNNSISNSTENQERLNNAVITGANESVTQYDVEGIYGPKFAPTPEQRAAMLEGAHDAERQRLEGIWARYDYVPGLDATQYDGPLDFLGNPDRVCFERWQRSRKEVEEPLRQKVAEARRPKLPIGVWPLGNGREIMEAVMEFANRNDADLALINQEGVVIPHGLHAYLGEITDVVDNIAFNGGFGREWGDSPKDLSAQRAAVRILARTVMELGELLGMKPDMEEEGETALDLSEMVSECVADLKVGKPVEGLNLAIAHLSNVAFPKKNGSIYAGNPFDAYQGGVEDMRATLAGVRLGRLCFDRIEAFGETYMEENGLSLEAGE